MSANYFLAYLDLGRLNCELRLESRTKSKPTLSIVSNIDNQPYSTGDGGSEVPSDQQTSGNRHGEWVYSIQARNLPQPAQC